MLDEWVDSDLPDLDFEPDYEYEDDEELESYPSMEDDYDATRYQF